MPISFYSPPQLTPAQSGGMPDILGNLLGGYEGVTKARYLRPGLEEELKKVRLYNQFYPEATQSEINLRNAQTEAAPWGNTKQGQLLRLLSNPNAREAYNNMMGISGGGNSGQANPMIEPQMQQSQSIENPLNPLIQQLMTGASKIPGLSGFMKQIPGLSQQQMQPGMPQANVQQENMMPQQANAGVPSFEDFISNAFTQEEKEYAPTDLAKTVNEARDVNDGFYPGTNRQVQIKNPDEQKMFRESYASKIAHMKAGESLVFDETGTKPIGERVHLTALQRERETGRNFYGLAIPVINDGLSWVKGKDSLKDFAKYAKNYSTDPVARQKIDDFYFALKLVTPTIVNEMQTIGSGKQRLMFQRLSDAFPGTDLPNIATKFAEQFVLPQEVFDKANRRASQFISEKTRQAAEEVPATVVRYFNPQVSRAIQNEMTSEGANEQSTREPTQEEAMAELKKRGL